MIWFWAIAAFILCVIPVMLAGPLFWYGMQVSGGIEDGNEGVKCQRRVRQLAQALAMYADTNNDRLPPGNVWVDATWKLAGKKDPRDEMESIYRCPSISKLRRVSEHGYALNRELAGEPRSVIADPERTPVVFDSDNLIRNALAGLDGLPKPPRHKGAKENYGAASNGNLLKL